MIKLIAGLGNPGSKYTHTKHNIGFTLIDQLRAGWKLNNFAESKKFHGWISSGVLDEQKIILLKPSTYMNRSGTSISSLTQYYNIPSEETLIIHDEIDFPIGKIALKMGGSHAGHNGLKDIINHLGTRDFRRLRIGVDRPATKDMVSEYVLSSFSPDQKTKLADKRDVIHELCRSFVHNTHH